MGEPKVLKKIYIPRVIFNIPIPPCDAVEPPEVLPPSITQFLADALEISDIRKSWDVLREYLWHCTPVPLGVEEYGVFKRYGWERGLSK